MYIVCVKVNVLPDKVDAFMAETKLNHRGARTEPGNLRFDVIRSIDDPSQFFLYEVYKDEQGFLDHQKTPHFLAWRDRAAPLMAMPRTRETYRHVFPEPWT